MTCNWTKRICGNTKQRPTPPCDVHCRDATETLDWRIFDTDTMICSRHLSTCQVVHFPQLFGCRLILHYTFAGTVWNPLIPLSFRPWEWTGEYHRIRAHKMSHREQCSRDSKDVDNMTKYTIDGGYRVNFVLILSFLPKIQENLFDIINTLNVAMVSKQKLWYQTGWLKKS